MNLGTGVVIVLGLALFEIVNSIDNAIINAEILRTMNKKSQRWFMTWGFFIAVFLVRGLLPWLIIWLGTPGIGPVEALLSAFTNNSQVLHAVESSAPVLLTGGGVFLIFLFLHWLFVEDKQYSFRHESFFSRHGIWFFAVVSVVLTTIVWLAIKVNPMQAFGAVIGSTAFFIVHGFKQNAEEAETKLMHGSYSDMSKILYLEVIDATFSIDGVLGAFAFTLSVPLIILGNGLGAWILRKLTLQNVDHIKKYIYLKNGAMYSIVILGGIMLLDGFGIKIPSFISPLVTFVIIGFFFWKSHRHIRGNLSA